MATYSFTITSDLAVKAEALWDAVVSPTDINAELLPLLKMTFPQGMDDITAGWQPGLPRFRSRVLLLALIPVDYDDIAFEVVEPGRQFLERSTLWSQSRWEHRRTLIPARDGTRLVDTVSFEPRWSVPGPLFKMLFRWIFRRRHRKLRRMYGQTGSRHEL